jgi:hypothetical protein
MTTILANPTDLSAADALHVRLAARIAAGIARAKARRDYRRMLEREDHVLADMGVSRRAVRQALLECGGRP